MANIRPLLQLRYGRQNEPVRVPIEPLLVDPGGESYLISDTASGVTSLVLKNTTNFSGASCVILIGEAGNQGAEILKTTNAGATTVNLVSATAHPHSASTPVRIIRFDQVEITNAATLAGAKTQITGSPFTLVANSDSTDANDTGSTTGFYFARFKNSVSGLFSPYSDPIPYGGYTIYSARSVIDKALNEINKTTSDVLSDEYAFQQLDNFQEEVLKEQKRWSFMQTFNYSLGQVSTGQWRVAAPTDLDDQFTNRGIWNCRIGKQPDMTFVDKEKWDEIMSFVAHSTLANSFSVGATTVTLASSSDFDDSGVIQVAGSSTTVTYVANNRTTGVLSGTSTTIAGVSGVDVFQGASLGQPLYWTIWQGYIYFSPLVGSEFNQRNIYLDYYKTQTQITADSDLLVIPDSTCAQYFLQWKFLKKLNNGVDNPESNSAMQQYLARREKLKQKNSIGRTFRLKPLLNELNENNSFGYDTRSIRDGNFPSTGF